MTIYRNNCRFRDLTIRQDIVLAGSNNDLLRVSIKGSELRMSEYSILNREGLLSLALTFFSGEVVANTGSSTEIESGGW